MPNTAFLATLNDWFSMIDDGKPVDVIYLDLKKHLTRFLRRLLTKLELVEGYGVHGQILCWIEQDFLCNRTQ